MTQPSNFDEIAKEIAAGKPVPAWLRSALPGLVDLVAQVRRGEHSARLPGRSEARGKLARIASLAKELAAELVELSGGGDAADCDPAGGGLARLVCAAAGDRQGVMSAELIAVPGRNWPMMAKRLAELSVCADAARDGIPTAGGGGETPFPDTPVPAARVLCAAIVSDLWLRLHSEPPGDRDKGATEAAQLLWVAAGGVRQGGEGAGWRRSFLGGKEVKGFWIRMVHANIKGPPPTVDT